MRRAAKRDDAEQPIVAALRAVGCFVYHDLRADLLIHRPKWGPGWFRVQEVKTEKRKTRASQVKQKQFIADTGVAIVRTVTQAIKDINS